MTRLFSDVSNKLHLDFSHSLNSFFHGPELPEVQPAAVPLTLSTFDERADSTLKF